MSDHLALAEQRFHARLANEDEATAALEFAAAREGKTLMQLLEELRARYTSGRNQ